MAVRSYPCAFATAALGGETVWTVWTADLTAFVVLLYFGAFTMGLAYGLFPAGLRTTTSATAVVATSRKPVTAAAVASFLSR